MKEKPMLIIDPGHGGKDPGGGSNQYFKEKDMTLKISLYQYQRFQELDVPVTITRQDDIYLSPTNRTKLIKDSGAKHCISNHINAAISTARGVETIHSIHAESKLARAIYQEIINQGMVGRRFFSKESLTNKDMDYYFMHRDTGKVITTIIEYGFSTNFEDTKLLLKNWKDYAEAVVRAFCLYIGHPYRLPNTKEETSSDSFVISFQEIYSMANRLGLDFQIDYDKKIVIIKKKGD